jgi:glycosyltransferase involved in cell wall biosynthesis
MPKISVVIPAKNEAANIGWVLERMPSYVDEVIVVDGLSTDGTLEVAKSISPDVIVVHETRPGKGAAMRAGFEAASGDFVVTIDADCSMDPKEIGTYVEALEQGYDLVKGSRMMPGGGSDDMTQLRRFGNARLRDLCNILYDVRFSELCYGYMGLRRARLRDLQLRSDGFEIETEIVTRSIRCGLRVAEVPSWELPRRFGNSNLNTFRDGWRVLVTLLRQRIRRQARTPATRLTPIAIASESPVESERAYANTRSR